MAKPCWRPRDESAMSPALREARETDTQKKNTQLSPLRPLPLPCPPKAQRQNKGAIVQRRQSPERQVVVGWASWAWGQLDERLGVAAQEMWLGTGGCNGWDGPEARRPAGDRLAPDSRLNPHRSLLGTGNYDVNVIMAALQGQGLAAVWWDRRRPLSQLALPRVLGLILNLPSPVSLGLLSLPLRRRHWVALRQVDGVYYNLDSKLRAPEVLGNEDGVRAFLAAALAQGLCEVLLVVTKEVEEKGSWLRTD
ncbi:josephin-2 isoform X1 [Globicephala melas]|uniref:josephin-2 isoform X1 n=1 Tax=Globicephala melas TaxID=9731 RepID=UPI00293D6350|nr:josephin-2 isoform X1 [Globicephala melas]